MRTNFIDIQNLQERELVFQDPISQKEYKKTYRDCKNFTFTPHNKNDVMRILQYFFDAKKESLQAKMPEELLQKAN